MSANYAPLIDRLSCLVRDRGDVELLLGLDRIMDFTTPDEQTAAFGAVVQSLSQKKTGAAGNAQTGQEN